MIAPGIKACITARKAAHCTEKALGCILGLGNISINRQYRLIECLQYHYRMYLAIAILLHKLFTTFAIIIALV